MPRATPPDTTHHAPPWRLAAFVRDLCRRLQLLLRGRQDQPALIFAAFTGAPA